MNFWPGPGGVVDHVEIFRSSSLITMQNLVAMFHIVWAYVGVPKIRGR